MRTKSVVFGVCGMAAIVGSIAMAQMNDDPKPGEMQLPPGWTEQDMQACIAAATPGDQHARLQKLVGNWTGTQEMWMVPDAPGMQSEASWQITSAFGGKYVKLAAQGDMPGMGKYEGEGFMGFDNVSQTYVSTYADNMGTGIMFGTGEASADGKSTVWTYTVNCPINKKPVPFKELLTLVDDNTLHAEMTAVDPKTGKEYKCVEIKLKRS